MLNHLVYTVFLPRKVDQMILKIPSRLVFYDWNIDLWSESSLSTIIVNSVVSNHMYSLWYMANRSNRHRGFEAGIRNVKNIPKNSSYVDMDQSLEWNKVCVSQDWISVMEQSQTGLRDIECFSAVFNFPSSVNQETGIIITLSFYTGGSELERNLFKVIQEIYSRTEIRNL